ncbi:hypothetical protein TNCV_3428121 [Trichonephila clavipes]|nr:hypothetical protein TNCV_3428121 [Trichonephila clavipes]
MERKVVYHLMGSKTSIVFKDLPDTIPDPIISAESSHRHPVTTNMQTTKSGRRISPERAGKVASVSQLYPVSMDQTASANMNQCLHW